MGDIREESPDCGVLVVLDGLLYLCEDIEFLSHEESEEVLQIFLLLSHLRSLLGSLEMELVEDVLHVVFQLLSKLLNNLIDQLRNGSEKFLVFPVRFHP